MATKSASDSVIETEVRQYLGEGAEQELPRSQAGGYKFTNYEEIKEQRRGMWDFVRSIGTNAFSGQNIANTSLPVYIFEPRSFLERITDNWIFLPTFLPAAADAKDPVQRFVYTIAFVISGLNATCVAKKPFNPILGETFQATYDDNTQVFLEQISHHPPISSFVVEAQDKTYKLEGTAEYAASIRGNALKGQQLGPNMVTFSDGGRIEWRLPALWMSGIMWGDRIMDYIETFTIEDKANNLSCTVLFNPDKRSFIGSWFAKQISPTDTFRGEVKHGNRVVGTVEGSWLSSMDWIDDKKNRKNIWDRSKQARAKLSPVENPLPSDSRFREDLQLLASGNLEEAQKWKETLENKQRAEKRMRTTAASS